MPSYLKDQVLQFVAEPRIAKRPKSDLLVVYGWRDKDTVKYPQVSKSWSKLIDTVIDSKDFKAKEKEILFIYGDGENEKRVALVGLGDGVKLSKNTISHAFAKFGQSLQSKEISSISCMVPVNLGIPSDESAEAVAYGLLHSNYVFTNHKGIVKSDDQPHLLKKVVLIGIDQEDLSLVEKAKNVCAGINLSRDLINTNADEMTASHLGEVAKEIAKSSKSVKADVYGKKWIEKNKMGLLLAVNRASNGREPAFIVLEYKGNSKSQEHTVLVGKGVTFDTGGLNLKPTGGMETMKADMSGAAIVLSTVYVASLLKLKVNVTAVVPATENGIGPESFKPGDVYKSYLGKTVEIGNTDAEGRLILADAISWSEQNLKPTQIIDVATLTGAMVVALGTSCAGLFTPNDQLAAKLEEASKSSNEMLWRMPLIESYKEQLKSYVADLSNVGQREGGSITAALFLQNFVEKIPWAHLDIAGVAFNKHPQGVYPKNATGYGVRLLIDLIAKQ